MLVDLGWAAGAGASAASDRPGVDPGYVREPSDPGWFTPADDPAARQFYALDPARIGTALGLPGSRPSPSWRLGPAGRAADPAQHLPRPPNDHLQYALTWYGLAAILAFMFRCLCRKGTARMTDAPSAYARLAARFARIATLGEAAAMLNWDAAAMMPAGGAAARGDQLAVLAGLGHGLLVAPEVADALDTAEAEGVDGDAWRAADLRLMRHAHTRATAVPGGAGGGADARQRGLREGLARGPRPPRVRARAHRT